MRQFIAIIENRGRVLLSLLALASIAMLYVNAATDTLPSVTVKSPEISLISYFRGSSTSVFNSSYQGLPKLFAEFPLTSSGAVDYSKGGAFPLGWSGLYQSGEGFSSSGLLVLPPSSRFDFIKINFIKPNQIELGPSLVWFLTGTYGIQKALPNASQGIRIQIVVSGEPIDTTDSGWAVIDDFTVTQAVPISRISNFGTWPLRKNFYFAIQASVVGSANTNENLVIDKLAVKAINRRPSLGIAQSNLIWERKPSDIVSNISKSGSRWIRTDLSTSSNAPAVANVVLASNQNDMKVLIVVLPEYYEDFIDPANSMGNADSTTDGPFKRKCGFSMGSPKVSLIDIGLFSRRLDNNLSYLRSVGAKVDAFEIGNELDWVCFNGDIKLGSSPIATSLPDLFYVKYGELLRIAKQKVAMYFPGSKVLSFGAANPGLFGAADSYVQDPQNMLAKLTFLNGTNYLQFVDAIGIHLYPASTRFEDILKAKSTISNYSSVSNIYKPLWITEWGFSAPSENASRLRYSAIRSFIELVNSMSETSISKLFLYTFYLPGDGFSFVDSSGNLESSLRVMRQYNQLLGE